MTTASTKRIAIDHPHTASRADAPAQTPAQAVATQVPFRGPRTPRGNESAQLSAKLPDWLRGDLARVAPQLGASRQWSPDHWFDGLGLAFGIGLHADRAELRWSLLDCDTTAAAMRGRVPFSHFATPNQRGRLAQLFGPIPAQTDNTNVNVQRLGDQLVAMTETEHQLVLDPVTLDVRSRVRYQDELGATNMLAHPILVGDTVTNLAMQLGRDPRVSLYTHAGASRTRIVRSTWHTKEVPYMHSFGLTERNGIIIAHPFTVNPLKMLWSNRGFIEHFRWKPSQGTQLVLMDLHDGRTHSHETEALFCFHTVHAFETADATVLDLLAYDDVSIVKQLSMARLSHGLPNLSPQLLRLSVDRRTGKVTRHVLSDTRFEFPQVDWDFVGTAAEQFVYGGEITPRGSDYSSSIVRVELATGKTQRFSEDGTVFGEPVFVGAPGRSREGDGALLTVGSSARGASLFVLDATTLDVISHASFETELPLGFHGTFVRA